MLNKVNVKFIEGIAGLADPRPKEFLDARYAKLRREMESRRPRAMSPEMILDRIEEFKVADRYHDVHRGFPHDFSYRPGEVAMIPATVAAAWVEQGICDLVPSPTGA